MFINTSIQKDSLSHVSPEILDEEKDGFSIGTTRILINLKVFLMENGFT